jgi:hypothetical protein
VAQPAGPTLGLPEDPGALLAEHAQTLDAAYREAGGRLAVNTEVRVDDAGKIHLTGVKKILYLQLPEPAVDKNVRTDGHRHLTMLSKRGKLLISG